MKLIENKKIQEKYYIEVLENGLTVFLIPKPQFYKTYAIFATKYGSRDTEFIPRGKNEFIKTPEGIAHFLEHKLFEQADGTDASNIFASYGADVNAFTTNSQTAYLFSTTSDVDKCLELLLDFVQSPNFTREGIIKEQGIIEQELLMYLDQPQNIQYYGILKALYKNNSIRNEIGGTVDSIKEIDEDLLYMCYNTFYHPSNMTLAVIGNFDKDETINLIKNNQKNKVFENNENITRKYTIDEDEINEKNAYIDMNVAIPKATIGIKFPYKKLNPIDSLIRFTSLEILIDLYFSESTEIYEELMNEGYINNSFEYSLYYDETYGHLLLNVDTQSPDRFIEKMKEIFNLIKTSEINSIDFNRIKKLYIARAIKRFNSLEYIANSIIESHMDGYSYFRDKQLIKTFITNDNSSNKWLMNLNNQTIKIDNYNVLIKKLKKKTIKRKNTLTIKYKISSILVSNMENHDLTTIEEILSKIIYKELYSLYTNNIIHNIDIYNLKFLYPECDNIKIVVDFSIN